MNKDKRKAALTLVATLVVGILLGMLGTGLFAKLSDRNDHGRRGGGRPENKKDPKKSKKSTSGN